MMGKIFLSLMIMAAMALAGCKEKLTPSYLMEHPAVLKQEIENCQATDEKSTDFAAHCETVMYAAANLMSVIDDQQSNPEKFGQRVIDAEVACVKARLAVQAANQAVVTLQQKKASEKELKAAQDQLVEAKKAYHEQQEELKILLAVLGMGSPE